MDIIVLGLKNVLQKTKSGLKEDLQNSTAFYNLTSRMLQVKVILQWSNSEHFILFVTYEWAQKVIVREFLAQFNVFE